MGKDFEAKVNRLKERVRTEPSVMVRVLKEIWDRQQAREKYYHVKGEHDGRGFSEEDTLFCNELYDKLEDVDFRWQDLRAIDLARGQRVVAKYARQYLNAQRERREREVEESRAFVAKMMADKKARADARARERWGDAAVVE